MSNNKRPAFWKYPALLLFGVGVSNIGEWIYFIALNLIVLDMTHSALAVSILYLIRPLAAIATNLWSGSVIDRMNKRRLMAALDFLRAGLIALLPLYASVWYMYPLVFLINMMGSAFRPASSAYTTMLIPAEHRPRFQSINALIGSGAFLTGPAIAGLLFLVGTPILAIYINAAAMAISGLVTLLLPNLEGNQTVADNDDQKLSWTIIKQDWTVIFKFYRTNTHIFVVCLLFSGVMMVMASAVDSLEAAFAQIVLGLTEAEYGVLVSISGAGIMAGAGVNAFIAKRASISWMIGAGVLGVSAGYFIYACSSIYLTAASGFFILAFFMAFANTGFAVFYQNNVPVELMGRVGSMNGLIEGILIMIITAVFGIAAAVGSIQAVVIAGVAAMLLLSFALSVCVRLPSNRSFYRTDITVDDY